MRYVITLAFLLGFSGSAAVCVGVAHALTVPTGSDPVDRGIANTDLIGGVYTARSRVSAMESDPVIFLRAAEYFRSLGNHEAAGTEALRFLFAAPEHPYFFYAHYCLAVSYLETDRIRDATDHFRLSLRHAPTPSVQRPIRWRLATALINGGSEERAKIELLRLTQGTTDSVDRARAALLLGVLFGMENRWSSATSTLERARRLASDNETFVAAVENVLEAVERLAGYEPSKDPDLAKALSTVFPGSGQLYAGRTFQGLTAAGLNAGMSYLVYNAVAQGSVVNASLLASSFWWRYYQGNRLHAEEHVIQHNQREQTELFGELKNALRFAAASLPDSDWVLSLDTIEQVLAPGSD